MEEFDDTRKILAISLVGISPFIVFLLGVFVEIIFRSHAGYLPTLLAMFAAPLVSSIAPIIALILLFLNYNLKKQINLIQKISLGINVVSLLWLAYVLLAFASYNRPNY